MISILGRFFAELRVWLGLNDPSENHLHQAHGWLLPATAEARVRGAEAMAARGRTGARPDSRQR
jgi:hypothetical protein